MRSGLYLKIKQTLLKRLISVSRVSETMKNDAINLYKQILSNREKSDVISYEEVSQRLEILTKENVTIENGGKGDQNHAN